MEWENWELEFLAFGDEDLSRWEFASISAILDFIEDFGHNFPYWRILLNGKVVEFQNAE